MSSQIYITDRSAAEIDDTCGMKFWWNRKEGQTGIVPREGMLALLIGQETHADLATIGKMKDISAEAIQGAVDDLTSPLTDEARSHQTKMEMLYRRLGWLAAFALYVEPIIRVRFETLEVEREYVLDRDPLWIAATPDRILRDKQSRAVVYREYKTTTSTSSKWSEAFKYSMQLHIGMAAVGEEMREQVSYAQVMGLAKGYYSSTDHRLVHPYVWGYYNEKTGKWACHYDQARGEAWQPMPVWEYSGGVVEWVKFCGEDVAFSQFPHTAPVFMDQRKLDEWCRRRLFRERNISAVEELCRSDAKIRELHFERRTIHCRPAFGEPCPYLLACWNAEVGADPTRNGEYVPRVPHHEIELTGIEERS